jgi:hypothetical protein
VHPLLHLRQIFQIFFGTLCDFLKNAVIGPFLHPRVVCGSPPPPPSAFHPNVSKRFSVSWKWSFWLERWFSFLGQF